MFWQAIVYFMLFLGGLASDNGPDTGPFWIGWTFTYGFQTIVLVALLFIAALWVAAAPQD